MADLKYVVDVDLNLSGGDPLAQVGRIGGAVRGLGDQFFRVGGRLAEGLEGALDKAGSIALTLGKIGAAAGVGAITYGVIGLNQELESTQVSLAAVLNANKIGGGIEGAMGVAAGWMRQMKQDAKDLPGEFSDLLQIVQSGAGSAFNAGLDVMKFEKLASQGMAAAKAMAVPIDQAGRELAQLLEGRAGAHNVFGTRLGIHAETFRGKTPEERVQLITAALGKFEPAIKAFGSTMDAQSSTLLDNAKTFLGGATLPLFDKIKGTLVEVNAWFDRNQTEISLWSTRAGDLLGQAFDVGKGLILEYGPDFLSFALRAKDAFVDIWKSAEPYMKAFGDYLHGFLRDDKAIDKLITLAKVWGAMKVGNAMTGLFGGFTGAGAGGGAGGLSGAFGAAGSALTLGAAGFAAGSAAGGQTAGMMVGGGLAGARLGFGAAGAPGAAIGAAVGVAAGGILELGDAAKSLREADVAYDMVLLAGAKDVRDSTGMIDTSSRGFNDVLQSVTDSASILDRVFGDVAGSMQTAAMKLNALAVQAEIASMKDKAAAEISAKITAGLEQYQGTGKRITEAELRAQKARGAAGRGSGGTTIHKVEISVSTNQNPGQVARQVGAFLSHASRFRTSSPYTRSFTAPG